MNRDELRNTLQALHEQLSGGGEIDKETQALLQTVTADIEKVLHPDTEAEASDAPGTSVAERLRETLIEFEARHPHLGGLLERITAGLAGMGI